mgnify:CR=1 FL=1
MCASALCEQEEIQDYSSKGKKNQNEFFKQNIFSICCSFILATCFGLNLIHLQANKVLTKLVKIAKRSHLSGPKVALRLEGDFMIDSKRWKGTFVRDCNGAPESALHMLHLQK